MSKHRTKKRFFAVGLAFSLVLATFQPVSAVTDTKGHWGLYGLCVVDINNPYNNYNENE